MRYRSRLGAATAPLLAAALIGAASVGCRSQAPADAKGSGSGATPTDAASAPASTATSAPPPSTGGSRRRTLFAGDATTCTRKADGTIWCWGEATPRSASGASWTKPVSLHSGHRMVELAMGSRHTCLLRDDGRVLCLGTHFYDQGPGPQPQGALLGLTEVAHIASGHYHTCALRRDATAWCWGRNDDGQLGDGSTTDRSEAVRVKGLEGVVALEAGGSHACALRADGATLCWGHNQYGELGVGEPTRNVLEPRRVQGDLRPVQLSLASFQTCAAQADGAVLCWGEGSYGALGTGNTERRFVPTPVAGLGDVVQVAVGGFAHACALRRDRSVWCWGYAIGLGQGAAPRLVPSRVAGIDDAVEIALGHTHACAKRVDGAVLCWGANESAQLGDGTTAPRATPMVTLPP